MNGVEIIPPATNPMNFKRHDVLFSIKHIPLSRHDFLHQQCQKLQHIDTDAQYGERLKSNLEKFSSKSIDNR